jgi:hypothetical protein
MIQYSKEEVAWRLALFLERLEERAKVKDASAQVSCKTTFQAPFAIYEIDVYTDKVDDCYVIQYNQMTGQLRFVPAK